MRDCRALLKDRRRDALSAAVMLGGKHPPQVREIDIYLRTVTLADGAVLNLDQWMASC